MFLHIQITFHGKYFAFEYTWASQSLDVYIWRSQQSLSIDFSLLYFLYLYMYMYVRSHDGFYIFIYTWCYSPCARLASLSFSLTLLLQFFFFHRHTIKQVVCNVHNCVPTCAARSSYQTERSPTPDDHLYCISCKSAFWWHLV